jgi:hypothetical protein
LPESRCSRSSAARRWFALVNRTQWSQVMTVHGHVFRLLHPLDDGWEPYFLDTLHLPEGTTSRIAFDATNPGQMGDPLDHCRALRRRDLHLVRGDGMSRRWRGGALLPIAVFLLSLTSASAQERSWTEEKCLRYTKAWTEMLTRRGTNGLGEAFLARHEAFLASGCTSKPMSARVRQRSLRSPTSWSYWR